MARRYFGTDGIRGVVGDDLTPELVERIGRAAALWGRNAAASGKGSDPGRVLIGRDTRASGPVLEDALARGVASAGATAVLAGVLPTPAVALLADDLGAVVSASHNPPEYNGVKLFAHGGASSPTRTRSRSRNCSTRPPRTAARWNGSRMPCSSISATSSSVSATRLDGLRIAVDCANGAFAPLAPAAFRDLGAEVHAIGVDPDGTNINVGCGATDLAALSHKVVEARCDLGVAFDGDGDRMLAVDERGEPLDGDQILAILALALGVDVVAVTVMANLGFHRLMAANRIRVVTTPVGDRYLVEALHREDGLLGGEQSGHIVWLGAHVSGDGLAAALLLCRSLGGRTFSEASMVMPRYPQAKQNIRVRYREIPQSILDEADRVTAELGERGRVLVRPSGTEPVVRVLAEAKRAGGG